MTTKDTGIEGLTVIKPTVFKDSRGYFYEAYNQEKMEACGLIYNFIQDNQSRSVKGVIRGLHFQRDPHAQTKLIRVSEGLIYDVALDMREHSPTFGKWFGIELSAENHLQLLIPKGFAHGFSVLSPHATIFYKCDAYYHPESESGVRFDDPELRIDWKVPLATSELSEKDRVLPHLKDI